MSILYMSMYMYTHMYCLRHIYSRPGVMGSWEPCIDPSYGTWISTRTVNSRSTEPSLYPYIKCNFCA